VFWIPAFAGMTDATPLRDELLALIRAGADAPVSDQMFDRLALSIFSYQFSHNAVYRSYCESRGATPGRIGHWSEMPAVPTDAFKVAALICDPGARPAAVFRTSGTTSGTDRRGAHIFTDLTLYDASLKAGFQRHLLPDGLSLPIISLVPPPEEVGDSSLSYMMGEVIRELGSSESVWAVRDGVVRTEELLNRLKEIERRQTPVLLAGTSFAFVHLLDTMKGSTGRVSLPPLSRIMDTGGFKGRSREVSRRELYAALSDRLGVPPPYLVNEYGMTEMSSQLYDGVAGEAAPEVGMRLHVGPGWVRTVAYDPETLTPLPAGGIGVLRHWDLANLDSVAVLQTADLGKVTDAGVSLLGRATGAEARGCSIAMEELLGSIES
jgi:hypothetical protein